MKKSYFVLVAIAMLSVKIFSQDRKTKFSVNPIQLGVLNMLNFEYERSFNEGGVGVAFYYGNNGQAAGKIGGYKTGVSEQSITIKKYGNSFSSNSFWYGAQLSVASGWSYEDIDYNHYYFYEEPNQSRNIGTLGVSFKVGYQFIIDSFYLDFHAGLGYALTNDLFGDAEYSGDLYETKLLIPYGIKMGINF